MAVHPKYPKLSSVLDLGFTQLKNCALVDSMHTVWNKSKAATSVPRLVKLH